MTVLVEALRQSYQTALNHSVLGLFSLYSASTSSATAAGIGFRAYWLAFKSAAERFFEDLEA